MGAAARISIGGSWLERMQPSPAPSPTLSPDVTTAPTPDTTAPIAGISGTDALWFIGVVATAAALLWALPLLYDVWQANRWRAGRQYDLLKDLIAKPEKVTVEEIRQLVSAMDTQPRGTHGLTRSLLGLTLMTFVGVAMLATLVSTAADSGDLRKTIVTSLLSILATIAGFYFGARTAQSSTEQVTRPPTPTVEPAPGPNTAGGSKSGGDS